MRAEKPVVSVIMPCYNAGKYIEASVRSFLENTWSRKCELIIVNDGSTDSSPDLIRSMMKESPEGLIRLVDIPNSGVSSARNRGLEEAAGEYVAFLDADDSYGTLFLEVLLTGIRECGADVNYCFWTPSPVGLCHEKIRSRAISRQEALDMFLYRKKRMGVWSMLFRREIIEAGGIAFSRDIRYGEDIEFLWRYILRCGAFAVTEAPYYYYRQSPDSAMSRTTWNKTDILEAMRRVGEAAAELDPEFRSRFEAYMIPRKVLALQKDFAQAGAKEYFTRLARSSDRGAMKEVIARGKAAERSAAFLYLVSPGLFYRVFSKLSPAGRAARRHKR